MVHQYTAVPLALFAFAAVACMSPTQPMPAASEVIAIGALELRAALDVETGEVVMTIRNESATMQSIGFGGCSIGLVVYEASSDREPVIDTRSVGSCFDQIRTVEVAGDASVTFRQYVASPSALAQALGPDAKAFVHFETEAGDSGWLTV